MKIIEDHDHQLQPRAFTLDSSSMSSSGRESLSKNESKKAKLKRKMLTTKGKRLIYVCFKLGQFFTMILCGLHRSIRGYSRSTIKPSSTESQKTQNLSSEAHNLSAEELEMDVEENLPKRCCHLCGLISSSIFIKTPLYLLIVDAFIYIYVL